jgi:DNA polymerase-3 subunit epsilon
VNILILDVETTNLDPATGEVVEVGSILYSVEHRAVLQQVSTLLLLRSAPKEDCNPVNGIPYALCREMDRDFESAAIDLLEEMSFKVDFFVAFKSDFDRQWFDGVLMPDWQEMRWSDAMAIRYPKPSHSRSLVNLCLAHDIPVVSAHRALTDCQLLAQLLGKVENLEWELERAAQPKDLVRAIISREDNGVAKEWGFVWDDIIEGYWCRNVLPGDLDGCPFPIDKVEDPTVGLVKACVSFDEKQKAKNAGFRWNAPEALGCWSKRILIESAKDFDFEVEIIA